MAHSTLTWSSLSSVLFVSLWTGSSSTCSTATRTRRPWHTLSHEDQMLYVDGFQKLTRESVMTLFVESHERATSAANNIHLTSQNFFWHSYWLWEMENTFRALGTEYECFTLPYWDVTHDADAWSQMDPAKDINELPIYNSNLGGNGDIDNDYCVGDPWSKEYYVTDSCCADDEEAMSCCLKRFHEADGNDSLLWNKADFAQVIYADEKYANYASFSNRMFWIHGSIHDFVGSISGVHFNRNEGQPSADPLFPMFHMFIEVVRLLHEDCYQYDTLNMFELDDYMPNSFIVMNTTLDYAMDFSILCDGTDDQMTRLCSDTTITPRLMYDISPNTQFQVVYELGEFWTNNPNLKSVCADNLNSTWWNVVDAATDAEHNEGIDHEEESAFVSSDHTLQSIYEWSNSVAIGSVLFLVIGVIVMLLLRHCGMTVSKDKVKAVYGSTESV